LMQYHLQTFFYGEEIEVVFGKNVLDLVALLD